MSALVLMLLWVSPPMARPDGGQPYDGPVALPPLPFTWELPPKTLHEVPIDGTTYVAGVPVRLRYVMVNDTPGNIGRHFLDSFKRQGLYVEPDQPYDRALTGVDPGAIVTYTVVLQANAEGHTTVILGEAKPIERKQTAAELPVPPSAKSVVPVRFEGSTVLSFSVNEPEAAVKTFYARELPLKGFRPEGDGVWVRERERLELTVKGKSVLLKLRRAE